MCRCSCSARTLSPREWAKSCKLTPWRRRGTWCCSRRYRCRPRRFLHILNCGGIRAGYVVLSPPVQVPTAQIFAHPELTRNAVSITMRALSERQLCDERQPRNDLQSVVCDLYPEVARYIAWLDKFGKAIMTGSGACVFAEFTSRSQAEAVMKIGRASC